MDFYKKKPWAKMLLLKVCHPRYGLTLLMYTASPVYRFTLLQHPLLQMVGSCIPFRRRLYWYVNTSDFKLCIYPFLSCVPLQTKHTCEGIIYHCQEHKTNVQSSGGSRRFSGIEGYMMHSIHPQFLPWSPRTTLKYPLKTP